MKFFSYDSSFSRETNFLMTYIHLKILKIRRQIQIPHTRFHSIELYRIRIVLKNTHIKWQILILKFRISNHKFELSDADNL